MVSENISFAAQPSALGMQDRIFRQQEERQRAFERDHLAPALPEATETPMLELSPSDRNDPCVEVKELHISGATLLKPSFIDELKNEYENKCLTLDDINNITKRITNDYASRGYITSRALLGPQDLSSGRLEITIVEGTIERFEPAPSSGLNPSQLLTIFPGLSGRILNLRDIEQGLDQMNRLPSMNTTMRIEPGDEFGSSIVVIDNQPEKTWRVSAGVDNHGSRPTGRHQYTLTFEKDNYIGCFDQFMVTWNSDLHSFIDGTNSRANGNNRGLGIYETIPFGYWTLSLSFNSFDYRNDVFGMNDVYTSSGESRTFRIGLDRVMHRDADSKTIAGTSINTHHVRNFFEGYLLDASSYYLTTLGLSLSHSRRILGGSLSGRFEQRMGVSILGAEKDSKRELEYSTPRREYQKSVFSLNWYKPFLLGEQQFSWSSSFSAQLSPHTLYGSERFYIGSLYTVRGYEGSPLGGDEGMLLRNELAWTVPGLLNPLERITGPVQLYTAYDTGRIRPDKEDPYERGTLHGIAVGARSYGDLSFDVTFAKGISNPSFVDKKQNLLSASVRYTY